MKRTALVLFLFFSARALAQDQTCGTAEISRSWFELHPQKEKDFLQTRALMTQDQRAEGNRKAGAVTDYTIPVVFHVLHNWGIENISDAQIHDEIAILNRDFNSQNSDTSQVVAAFKALVGDAKVHFQLASIDPNGICTNGIIRHQVVNTVFGGAANEYAFTWPHDKYLNFYVVRSLAAAINYAAFTKMPGSGAPAAEDVIVTKHQYVGSIGTGKPLNSRILTHEVGHWLGLLHTWGSGNAGATCGDDSITDTPVTKGFNSCNLNFAAQCNPPVIENMQNFMDYSFCTVMFTHGQAQWMKNLLNSPLEGRNNLSSPANLISTGIVDVKNYCPTNLALDPYPVSSACIGWPVTVRSSTSIAGVDTYAWSADNGASVTSPSSFSTTVVLNNAGVTTLTCAATNNAGTVTRTLAVTGLDHAQSTKASWFESFEQSALPSGWWAYSTSTVTTWKLFNGAASHGAGSMFLAAEHMVHGELATLVSEAYDLSDISKTTFTFKYAYARRSANHQDVIRVQASSDCGFTWTDVYTQSGASWASGSGGIRSDLFIPDATQWKTVNLAAHTPFKNFLGQKNVRLRFYFMEDPNAITPGNRFYLDEINFTTTIGVSKHTGDHGLVIHPQPGREIALSFELSSGQDFSFQVYTMTGNLAAEQPTVYLSAGQHQLFLNNDGALAPGLYLLAVQVGPDRQFRKLLVE
jgi:hypothetical protein